MTSLPLCHPVLATVCAVSPWASVKISGGPVVFIVGLVVLATTGAVYELLPESK